MSTRSGRRTDVGGPVRPRLGQRGLAVARRGGRDGRRRRGSCRRRSRCRRRCGGRRRRRSRDRAALRRSFQSALGERDLLLDARFRDALGGAQRFFLNLLYDRRELGEGAQRPPLVAAFAPGQRFEIDRTGGCLAAQLTQADRPDRHAVDADEPTIGGRLLRLGCGLARGGHGPRDGARLHDRGRLVVVRRQRLVVYRAHAGRRRCGRLGSQRSDFTTGRWRIGLMDGVGPRNLDHVPTFPALHSYRSPRNLLVGELVLGFAARTEKLHPDRAVNVAPARENSLNIAPRPPSSDGYRLAVLLHRPESPRNGETPPTGVSSQDDPSQSDSSLARGSTAGLPSPSFGAPRRKRSSVAVCHSANCPRSIAERARATSSA